MAESLIPNNPFAFSPADIQRERQDRILKHQAKVVSLQAQGFLNFQKTDRPLLLLADGDSWFDYPLPWPGHSDIINQLPSLTIIKPTILNMAHAGDATTACMGVSRQERIKSLLQNPQNGKFDAILFSGGGDDLVGEQFCLWIYNTVHCGGNPNVAINAMRAGDIFGVIQGAYQDLMSIRDQYAPGIPIFVHSYDFALPTGKGAPCGIGPWLKPSLDYRGWNFQQGSEIVKSLLLQFDAMFKQLASVQANNLVYIHTQGTLQPPEWDNELHPTQDGFKKIAQLFLNSLRGKFPNRI